MTCTEQFTRLADKMERLGADNWTAAFAAGAAVQYGKTEEMMKFLEERASVTVAELNAKRDSIIREHYLSMRAKNTNVVASLLHNFVGYFLIPRKYGISPPVRCV